MTAGKLRDREWLEQEIQQTGIYPAQEIPSFLWQTNGGLGICQFPNQFAPYLIELSKLKITSYAEIGLWVGGTFRFTVEYLQHFGLKRALGIDINLKPEVRAYENPIVSLLEAPSDSPEAAKALQEAEPDLILVDGDHTEEGCRTDWELASSLAPYVAIHDIAGSGFPGVVKVWNEIDLPKKEWTDQYESTPQNGMGLVTCATA